MTGPDPIAAARSFIRCFNVLLKQVGLFGPQHRQCMAQFDLTWRELGHALQGQKKLIIAACGEHLLLDGKPVKPTTAERSFLNLLANTGITGLEFSASVTPEEFNGFSSQFATAKPGTMWSQLKHQLSGKLSAIRVHEFQLAAPDNSAASNDTANGTGVSSSPILESALGASIAALPQVHDPQLVLRLLLATGGATENGTADAVPELHADDVEESIREVVRWFAAQSDSEIGSEQANGALAPPLAVQTADLPANKSAEQDSRSPARPLLKAFVMANQRGTDPVTLVKIAEQLAIRVARDQFERGDTPIDAVQQTLHRMAAELQKLRQVLRCQQEEMSRAGLNVQAYGEELDAQFWAGIPEHVKGQVLLSPDCWCIPPQNIRSFVAGLLERNGAEMAERILDHYSQCLDAPRPEPVLKTAQGVLQLADLYATCGEPLLVRAIQRISAKMAPVPANATLHDLLQKASLSLSRQAAEKRMYSALAQSVTCCREPEKAPNSNQTEHHIELQSFIPEFVNDALRLPVAPGELVTVLQHNLSATVHAITDCFQHCTTREERHRIIRLIDVMQPPSLDYLRRIFLTGPEAEAVRAIGLLSLVDMPILRQYLGGRARHWTRLNQYALLQQLANAGAEHRADLLLELVNQLDPLTVPQVLDEIGVSGGRVATQALIRLVQDGTGSAHAACLQVKAIEALGRLQDPAAEGILCDLVSRRKMLRWDYPPEVRTAALEALKRINPATASRLITSSGLEWRLLSMVEGAANTGRWTRQRRYRRTRLNQAIFAAVKSERGDCTLILETLSLGGGMGTSLERRPLGEGTLEIPVHLRPVRSHVALLQHPSSKWSFDIIDISLEDRFRLRRFLAAQTSDYEK